jgi:hypothetical protein
MTRLHSSLAMAAGEPARTRAAITVWARNLTCARLAVCVDILEARRPEARSHTRIA